MDHNKHRPSPDALHPPTSTERSKEYDPFSFINPEAVQQMRYNQYRFLDNAEEQEPSLDIIARRAARVRARDNLDVVRTWFLEDYGVDTSDPNDPQYKEYMDWIRNVSIDNMNDTQWRNTTIDAGNKVPSGYDTVSELHDTKLAEYRQEVQNYPDDVKAAMSIADRLVADTRNQMNEVGARADEVQARSRSLLSPDVTQPVPVNPNMNPPHNPDQTQNVPIDPEANIAIPRGMIEKFDNERNNEIQAVFNHLKAARENLATLAKGNKETLEYKKAQQEWAYYMGEYGRVCERREKSRDPNRTHDDFVRDATWYAIDQISRLDELAEQKKDEKLHRRFIKTFKNNKVVQGLVMGVTFGAASLAQKKDPVAAAAAALAGAFAAPKLAEVTGALVDGRNAQPHTSYSADVLRATIRHSGDIHAAARFLGERFTKDEKERRKKAGRKAVLGGLATTVALISTSMLPEHIDWHSLAGTETIDGYPMDHEGPASATRPDRNPFDIDGSNNKTEEPSQTDQPDKPQQPGRPEQPSEHGNIPPTPNLGEIYRFGLDIPLQEGDGALDVAERWGLNADQQQRLLELLSQRQDASTYMGPDGVRLHLNEGVLHLSSEDLKKIDGA